MNNTVAYGLPSVGGKYEAQTIENFSLLVQKCKEAIEKQNLWVIAEINPQIFLEKVGYHILEARQVLFFHPHYMAKLLTEDPKAVIVVPLKIVLIQLPNKRTLVQATDTIEVFRPYPKLMVLAQELDGFVEQIFKDITKI